MLKPSQWLQDEVKHFESEGAKLFGYGILRDDIDYVYNFPKCVYAILDLSSKETLLICDEKFREFHDGWHYHRLDKHCWWEEREVCRLNKKSFNLIQYKGFWL